MYRCDVCDFDACPACFNKKDKATGEGVMRGDKGVRDVLEVGRMDYLMRGARLIAPHLPLFLFALLCLLMQSVASLVLPNFQGQIFDHIIQANHECKLSHSEDCDEHVDSLLPCDGVLCCYVSRSGHVAGFTCSVLPDRR